MDKLVYGAAVMAQTDYVADEKYPASILFNLRKVDEYLEALRENEHVTDIYIVASDERPLKKIREKINAEIGNITVTEPLKIPMSAGFKTNTSSFKLGFPDRTSIALDEQFAALLPLLWLKAGGIGACPEIAAHERRDFYIFPENIFAVLRNEQNFPSFKARLDKSPGIRMVYLITDSLASFQSMAAKLSSLTAIQLYSDYLNNFRINQGNVQ